ncbi:unnamed protein product [Ambrosiozyma monospora]|uniref:Unnamed protein product n=1 Tax=Ambrosiozyma monospora TaxID=43982 RepID=A0A9W7DFL2_AMBMO|nr:unnamed protein product [Ambrosiozyma monospora]
MNEASLQSQLLLDTLANSPIFIIEARDEVLDMITMTSLGQEDEWSRRVGGASNATPRSFIKNIYNAMSKEKAKGTKWAVLYGGRKSEKVCVVDLQR